MLVCIAVSAAGCSSDTTRFGDWFGGPSRTSEITGSVPSTQSAPASYATAPVPPPPPPAPKTSARSARGNGDITGSVPRLASAQGKWDANSGTAITIAPGDTLESVSRKHGVPVAAILQANNLSGPVAIKAGERLIIPAPAGKASRPLSAGVHVVAPGETLSSISRRYGRSLGDVARVNNIAPQTKVNIGDRLVIPGMYSAAQSPGGEAAPGVAQQQAKAAQQKRASLPQQSTAHTVTPAAEQPEPDTSTKAVKSAEAAGALPSFRWPAQGRIITGFGPKPNGQQNDGINLAVPEGTPIKAAEEGVVAYAGNELKGYGNLVLVRHPNGYVTAYAHASELLVKRNDQVKRGQVIARAGQTGNVSSPQLHFEIRKGATPVDPTPFLGGG